MQRLLLTLMSSTSKWLMSAMVLDRLDEDDLDIFKQTNQPGLQIAAET